MNQTRKRITIRQRRTASKKVVGTNSDYKHDIFVSYKHCEPVSPWVVNVFLPTLQRWLGEGMGGVRPRIFFDQRSINWGSHWAEEIIAALKTSRLLLAICSPSYFMSNWCRFEWNTFAKREQATKRTPLRLPIRYYDGEHFPPEAHRLKMYDLSPWTWASKAFEESAEKKPFEETVRGKIVPAITAALAHAPPFQSNWPVPSAGLMRELASRLPSTLGQPVQEPPDVASVKTRLLRLL